MPYKFYMVTFRTVFEGGKGDFNVTSEEEFFKCYKKLLEDIINEVKCHYIDVEIKRGAGIISGLREAAHQNGIAIIGSYHNFEKTPGFDEMLGIMQSIDEEKADIIKMLQ